MECIRLGQTSCLYRTCREAYQAMESGVVDTVAFAQHAHLSFGTINQADWWTANLNPGTVNCPVVVNIDAYDSLSDAERSALDSSIEESLDHYLANYAELLTRWDSVLEEKGVKKIEIASEVIDEFRAAAAAPARDAWIANMESQGLPGQELYDLVVETLAQAKTAGIVAVPLNPIEIGLWVSGGMLVFVILGMRVAFAAAMAGFVGLVWLRWNGFDYDPAKFWKAVEISVKIAGLTPHSKVSAQVLSLIPVFIMIGYLAYNVRLAMACIENPDQPTNSKAMPSDEATIHHRLKALSQDITSSHADLLELLVRYDDIEGWKTSGASHCAAWMNLELGISLQLG